MKNYIISAIIALTFFNAGYFYCKIKKNFLAIEYIKYQQKRLCNAATKEEHDYYNVKVNMAFEFYEELDK